MDSNNLPHEVCLRKITRVVHRPGNHPRTIITLVLLDLRPRLHIRFQSDTMAIRVSTSIPTQTLSQLTPSQLEEVEMDINRKSNLLHQQWHKHNQPLYKSEIVQLAVAIRPL